MTAPVVKWIERGPPKAVMWVRLPPGAHCQSFCEFEWNENELSIGNALSEGEEQQIVFSLVSIHFHLSHV